MPADEARSLNEGDSIRTGLEAALAAWAGDSVLAGPLTDSARAFLVVDGAATTVRHVSPAATALARAWSDGDGVVDPALGRQIRAIGGDGRPRLARLRLDPRRIAPPTACLIAAGILDGAPVLLLVVTGPLPAFRPRPASAVPSGAGDPPPAAEPDTETAPAVPVEGDRFVWRSDAADRIIAISGPSAGVLAPALVGASWAGLAETGRLSGAAAFLSALQARRTFRAASARLVHDIAGTLALEMSGACLGRGGEPFSGFGGYGVVRAVTPSAAPETSAADGAPDRIASVAAGPVADASAVTKSAATESAAPAPADTAPPASEPAAPPTRTRFAAWPPVPGAAARFGGTWSGAWAPEPPAPAPPAAEFPPASEPPNVAEAGPAAAPVTASEAPDAALSVTEHAAFREIARALGARYAGDDEIGGSDAPAAPRGEGGAVMPFPVARAAEPGLAPPTDAARLDDLPVALLIHRGDAVLAANRRLLDLTGHGDLESLRTTGLTRLFRGLPPEPGGGATRGPLLIETVQDGSRPVAIEHGPATWEGEPAECLILRAAPEPDIAGEEAAERLARSFRDGHAADARATLDALEDGVVTLDPAGRIVAMNRAAAGLFGCEPREVVGAGFETLFEASHRDAVRAGIEGLGTETATLAAGGRPLALRVSGHHGTRVAVLRPVADHAAPAVAFDPPVFLARLDREIRTPVEGLVGLTDGILAEPHGPIDERYRVTLRAIKAAGGHVRGLVSDLIDLATIESGGLALAVRPLPLNEMVSGCVELLQPEAARGRIVLRTSFSPDLAPLEADEPSMRQAALTVIGTAIRATGAGGQVIVSTAPGERGGVALKVRGTGPGTRPDDGVSALEPLAAGAGGGLGLPLSKALVEANHGRLLVSSRGNEGTLVEILLPGPHSRSA